MKRVLLLLVFVVGLISFSNAQTMVGGGLAYGTEVDDPGIFVDGEFFLKNELALSPDFIFYFWDDPVGLSRSFWELNFNLNYYFIEDGPAEVYGIGGLNLSTARVKYDSGVPVIGGETDTNSELGINLGVGANFDINASVTPFGEFKFTIGDFDQAVLMFGLKFPLR